MKTRVFAIGLGSSALIALTACNQNEGNAGEAPKAQTPKAEKAAGDKTIAAGLAPNSKLSGGTDISTVEPLPGPHEFELRGYSQCPAGLATDDLAYVSHPLYPPGLGAPQWDLAGVSQARLKLLTRVQRGEFFSYDVKRLAPLP